MGTTYAEPSGHPVEVTALEVIDKIHDIVMDNRRLLVPRATQTNVCKNFAPTFGRKKSICRMGSVIAHD